MHSARVERSGRGLVRGLLFFSLLFVMACDKTPPAGSDAGKAPADVSTPAADVEPDVTEEPDLPPPPPPALAPPWTQLAPDFNQLTTDLADKQIGTMSGEAWGKDVPVRGVVRAQCGSGALIQAVFAEGKGLGVTAAMPLRFIGVGTTKPVTYTEGGFNVTVNFSHDTPERLAGSLKITYDEHGREKTFIHLQVDGKPMQAALKPRLSGEGNLPELPNCHPSGRFYAKTADGREATGFVNAVLTQDGNGAMVNVLMSPQAGLRLVVLTRGAVKEPYEVDLSKEAGDGPVRVVAGALFTPELTSPETAEGPNLGSQQELSIRAGTASVLWPTRGKSSRLELRFENLRVPELIEGPLRGTTFTELVIDTVAYPVGVYPAAPPPEPLAPAPKE